MTESQANEIKRRKKGKKNKGSKTVPALFYNNSNIRSRGSIHPTSGTKKSTNKKVTSSDQQSLWGIAKKSPIFWISALVMIPYSLYNLYLFLFLQHPEIISMATMYNYKPRAAVKLNDKRQLLIVGSISSGTTQVSHDLSKKLGLEIGHENAETNWSFVRDGTVSWFHGIRYIPRPGMDKTDGDQKDESIYHHSVNELCKKVYPHMGFHPFMFRDGKCNIRQSWDSCWKEECKQVLKSEWGCALNNNESCVTPFQTVLHQVRHPLRTIESLVTKFCIHGVEGKVQPVFLTFSNALFPQHDFANMSCIEAAGYYVNEYNNAMMAGKLDHMFQIEEVTPCNIAEMAGFMDSDAVFEHSRIFVQSVCEDKSSEANQLMRSTKNTYNSGKLSLTWDDLLGGRNGNRRQPGDDDLYHRIKKLSKDLGYY